MPDTTLISVRVPAKTAKKLAALATATDRSKSYLAAQAIEEYLATQEWQIKAIKAGIASANANELVDHSAVVDWVKSWATDNEKEIPE